MDFKEVADLSRRIMELLMSLPEIQNSQRIFGYMSFKNEVDCYDLMHWCLESGRRFKVPKVYEEGRMAFYRTHGLSDLVNGAYGILEPSGDRPEVFPEPGDVIIVPGVAFSEDGYRIGYGGGFYDRYLESYPEVTAIGLAYENQMEKALPIEDFDCQLRKIVTDSRVLCTK